MKLLAQKLEINGQLIEGPLKGINSIADILNIVLAIVYPTAGLVLLAMLIYSGFKLISSAGEEEKLQAAKKSITYSILGIVLLALSYVLIRIISYVTGLGQDIF